MGARYESGDPDATQPIDALRPALAVARGLAEVAIERAVQRDAVAARAAIDDVSVVLANAADDAEAARVRILVGEALLALREPALARERFERSFLPLLANDDRAGSARAVLGVARALQMLGDAGARDAFAYAELLFGTEPLEDDQSLAIRDRSERRQS